MQPNGDRLRHTALSLRRNCARRVRPRLKPAGHYRRVYRRGCSPCRERGNDRVGGCPSVTCRTQITAPSREHRGKKTVNRRRTQNRRSWGRRCLYFWCSVTHVLITMVDGATGRAVIWISMIVCACGSFNPESCQFTCQRSAYIRINRGGFCGSVSSGLKAYVLSNKSRSVLSQVSSCGGGCPLLIRIME
jgi:hypothetical protein